MKKIGTLALTLALAGSLTVPALAAEAPATDAADTYTVILNGETLDLSGVPGDIHALPMRLVAEADHGSAYWDEENNESWFYFGDNRIVVSFSDNSVTVNDEPVIDIKAEVIDGTTFLPADIFDHMEGYSAVNGGETGAITVTITTPNNDPMVKLAYQIKEECSMAFGMRYDAQALTDAYGIPAGSFEQVVAFFPMNTSPDTLIIGKLAEGADEEAVKAALETYRQGQEDIFSWYLGQHLPKVQDARTVVQDGWLLFLIGENADAGVEAFNAFVEAQTQA